MQSQLSQEKINNAKINVLVEYGLDPSIAQYVKGGTAEEIEADVRYLREMFDNKPQEPGPMKSVEPNSLGDDPYTRMIKQMG
ncbi:hypothetical protein QP860_03450 [Aerococcus sp. UMB1112A]|uniref:hypothetical protein n=1 Tax=Aerococcus sp. UMB1112A TaxID=3050609 RepID=UPI00254CA612|nr:hypothetical protein [Aerococcus sp. UMB1112A]MDK8502104.1 hypothetical protein [Aerococcus sp. UMB1112A]